MGAELDLAAAVARCLEQEALDLVRKRIVDNVPAESIIAECNGGMAELGDRFERGDCFIPELIFAGDLMKKITAELAPLLEPGQDETAPMGRAVIGSVQNDVHDIGKDIVVSMLRGNGFDVIDLGIDVPPQRFVDAVRENSPVVVGMSILLTTCYGAVTATVDAIEEAGLRRGLPIMLGGAAASNLVSERTGCDFYGKTAMDGVRFALSAVEGK